MLTSLATGLRSFCGLRFLLGVGEAANWPGATKAVAEWFPRRERGWAVALFDSGSSSERPSLGAGAVSLRVGGRLASRVPDHGHARLPLADRLAPQLLPAGAASALSEAERREILEDRAREGDVPVAAGETAAPPVGVGVLLARPQTWGAIAARGLTDPVWFMITDWFAIYLVGRGFKLEETALGFWVPFLAADLGNFFGGGVSSALIRRGWSVGRARRFLIVAGGFGVLALIPAALSSTFLVLVACFAIATFSYAVMSTMASRCPPISSRAAPWHRWRAWPGRPRGRGHCSRPTSSASSPTGSPSRPS
jgi:ACS family hexuronate transporter-like MFS transporter